MKSFNWKIKWTGLPLKRMFWCFYNLWISTKWWRFIEWIIIDHRTNRSSIDLFAAHCDWSKFKPHRYGEREAEANGATCFDLMLNNRYKKQFCFAPSSWRIFCSFNWRYPFWLKFIRLFHRFLSSILIESSLNNGW